MRITFDHMLQIQLKSMNNKFTCRIISILILLTCVSICWSSKPIDYTPLLKFLDDDIVRDLIDPIEGRSQKLIDNVDTYNDRLGDVKDMIEQNVYEAYVKAVELQKIGGPQFLQTKINNDLLKRVYKWSDDDLISLQKQFEITKKCWKEVEDEFKPAEKVFKQIQEKEAKEKAEQAEREQKRAEELKKIEEEHSKNISVNVEPQKSS